MAAGQTGSHNKLLRVLGLAFGLAAVVGSMVGQGILRTPGIVAGAVHSPSLILLLWGAGAAVVAISAVAYLELGTAIPSAGGPYDYVRRAFGDLAGVTTGWACWLMLILANAYLAMVVGEFLQRLGVLGGVSTSLIAVAVLALFWGVNWTGTRFCGASQIAFSTAKGLILIGFVVLVLSQPGTPVQQPPALQGVVGIAGVAVAMRVITSTYNGWQDAAYFCEELENPGRTLPRSMVMGVVGVTALYLLVNVALLHVMSPDQMAVSNLPAADAAQIVLGARGERALTMFGILSVAAITNLTIMKAARIPFAMARQGQMPSQIQWVASGGTPRWALTATVVLSVAFAASGTYTTLLATNIALNVALFLAVNVAAMRLRQTEPKLNRPFRIPLYPVPVILAIIINLLLLAGFVYEDAVHSLEGFALLAVIASVYTTLDWTRKRAPAQPT